MNDMITFTGAQCKAARALLGWTQNNLAAEAGVSVPTIRKFETDCDIRRALKSAVFSTVVGNGIEFRNNDNKTSIIIYCKTDEEAITGAYRMHFTGQQLIAARALLDWTQEDLSNVTKFSAVKIGQLENSDRNFCGWGLRLSIILKDIGIEFQINNEMHAVHLASPPPYEMTKGSIFEYNLEKCLEIRRR